MLTWITESIRTYFRTLLQQKSEWTESTLDTGTYYTLTGVVSEGFAKEAYYVDYWTEESSWEGAQTLASRVAMAKDRAYFPSRRIGATGYIKVSPIQDFSIASYTYTGPNVPYYERTVFTDSDKQITVFSTETKIFRKNTTIINTTIDINSSAVNLGGNKVAIPVTGHGITAGSTVSIKGSDNYDGVYITLDSTTTDYIHIASSYREETFIGSEKISAGYLWIPVKEGVPKEYTFIANGEVNEVFELVNENVDNNYIKVYKIDSNKNILANVTVVDKSDDLYYQNDPDNYYCKVMDNNSFTKLLIIFGDDITTKKTQSGDRFLVIYGETTGASGNITSSNTINQIQSKPLDVEGNLVTFYYRNDYSISGGADWEEQSTIKRNTERYFYIGFIPGSKAAYEAILESHPDVQKSKVWTWLDIGDGTLPIQGSERQNEVFMTGVTTYGETFSPSLELDLATNYLLYRDGRDIPIFQPLQKLGIKFIINARVENLIKNEMEEALISTLNTNFDILNLEFAQDIYSSNYIRVIDGSTGILSHDTIAYYAQENEDIEKNFETLLASRISSDITDLDKQIYLTIGTFQIWIRRKVNGIWEDIKQIASAPSTTITGISPWSVSGSIVYSENKITYQLFDILADVPPLGETDYAPQWTTSTLYAINDEVVYQGSLYKCNTGHTSTTFAADIANWDFQMLSTFGIRNPDETENYGYVIYLMYRTEDGSGEQTENLRLAAFNQIFDFNSDLLVFNPEYP